MAASIIMFRSGRIKFLKLLDGKRGYVCDQQCLAEIRGEDEHYDAKKIREKIQQLFDQLRDRNKHIRNYYIGMSFVTKSHKWESLDPNKPVTWYTKDGVGEIWRNHRDEADGLVVVAATKKDHSQGLMKRLIHHYKAEGPQGLENDDDEQCAHVIYVAFSYDGPKSMETCRDPKDSGHDGVAFLGPPSLVVGYEDSSDEDSDPSKIKKKEKGVAFLGLPSLVVGYEDSSNEDSDPSKIKKKEKGVAFLGPPPLIVVHKDSSDKDSDSSKIKKDQVEEKDTTEKLFFLPVPRMTSVWMEQILKTLEKGILQKFYFCKAYVPLKEGTEEGNLTDDQSCKSQVLREIEEKHNKKKLNYLEFLDPVTEKEVPKDIVSHDKDQRDAIITAMINPIVSYYVITQKDKRCMNVIGEPDYATKPAGSEKYSTKICLAGIKAVQVTS